MVRCSLEVTLVKCPRRSLNFVETLNAHERGPRSIFQARIKALVSKNCHFQTTSPALTTSRDLLQPGKSSARKRRVCSEPQRRHLKMCSSSTRVEWMALSNIRPLQSGHKSDEDKHKRRRNSLLCRNKSTRSTSAVLAAKSIHLDSIA